MQPLEHEIAEKFNLEIRNIIPFRDGYIMNTSSGKKKLKKCKISPERVMFIHSVKEYLYQEDFKDIDRYICTREGHPHLLFEDMVYVVTDVIEGEECNFDKREDVVNASRRLAQLHCASEGYVPPKGVKPRDDLGKLPSQLNKRLDEIKKLRKTARKGKSKFDYVFLNYVDYFYELGASALELLSKSKYHDLVENTRKKGMITHHDYAHHNIICNGNKISVTNFEYSCFELRVYDIANFIRRKMRKCDWDVAQAHIILDHYQSVEKLSDDELLVLKVMLMFPQKFWRVINKFYNRRRNWPEKSSFIKLKETIDEIPHHKKFIEQFDHLV